MAHSGSDADAYVTHAVEPRRVARAGKRLGTALVGAAGPAVIMVFLVAATRGSTAGSASAWVSSAMETPLVGGQGAAWAFHVAAVAGLAGLWLVGFALVVEGYFGID